MVKYIYNYHITINEVYEMKQSIDEIKTIEQTKQESLAHRLRVVRGYYGQSQAEFAKKLEISQSAMSAIELGKVIPSADVIQKIGRMGFGLEWLLYGENKNEFEAAAIADTALNFEKNKINKLINSFSPDELRFCRQWLELYAKSQKAPE